MLSLERRDEIKSALLENQSITVSELSDKYNVSFETIRRDFDELEKEGFLTRTYGGAVLRKHVRQDVNYNMLSNLFIENKQRIVHKASEFVSSGDCIFIDHSTTVFQLIHEIKNLKLTIMSNSIKVLPELSEIPGIDIVSTGGTLNKELYCLLGNTAEKTVKNFYMDKAFLSCRAIDKQHGLSDKFEQEAEIRRTIIDNADSVYLLMDHTKFDKTAFVRTCDLQKITCIITDHLLSDAWKELFISNDISYYEVE